MLLIRVVLKSGTQKSRIDWIIGFASGVLTMQLAKKVTLDQSMEPGQTESHKWSSDHCLGMLGGPQALRSLYPIVVRVDHFWQHRSKGNS